MSRPGDPTVDDRRRFDRWHFRVMPAQNDQRRVQRVRGRLAFFKKLAIGPLDHGAATARRPLAVGKATSFRRAGGRHQPFPFAFPRTPNNARRWPTRA